MGPPPGRVGLIMLMVSLGRISLLLIGQQGLRYFFRHQPLSSHSLDDFEAPTASQSTFIMDELYCIMISKDLPK